MYRRLFFAALLLSGCHQQPARGAALPGTQTRVAVSVADQAKVELGFRLWFEPRLSGNDRMTCATCHKHTAGYSNLEATAAGTSGKRGDRNVPTILGAAEGRSFFWDGRAETLEAQALGPIENPIEMDAKLPDVVRKLKAHPYYPQKFQQAYGTDVDAKGIADALAAFERALRTKPNAVERYWAGEPAALTPQQLEGQKIFNSPRGRCVACHGTADTTDHGFHNIGVGYEDGQDPADLGRFKVTGKPEDKGAFKTPTLRNVQLSGPYMHDGSLATLEAVVDYYDRGGNPNPNQDPRIRPLNLNPAEKQALVAFLKGFTSADNLREIGKLPGILNPRTPTRPPEVPLEVLK